MNTTAHKINNHTINCSDAKNLIEQQAAILIDVRDFDEYRFEHIPGARNIPLTQCVAELKTHQQPTKIILQCQSGRRSQQATAELAAARTDLEIYSLEGGIAAWKSAGLTTQRSQGTALPIMRQVQIAAGSLVLLGVILATTVAPLFWIVPGFVGAGLIFAGITGFCGMANLLQSMPWNRDSACSSSKSCCG